MRIKTLTTKKSDDIKGELMNAERTHWEGCWTSHKDCHITKLQGLLDRYRELGHEIRKVALHESEGWRLRHAELMDTLEAATGEEMSLIPPEARGPAPCAADPPAIKGKREPYIAACPTCARHRWTDGSEWLGHETLEDGFKCKGAAKVVKDNLDLTKGGVKYDTGKPALELVAPEFLVGMADVLTYGANKYRPRNWEAGMRWGRPLGALFRHVLAWMGGEENDPESGKHHLDHAACCLMFLRAYVARNIGEDDRKRSFK